MDLNDALRELERLNIPYAIYSDMHLVEDRKLSRVSQGCTSSPSTHNLDVALDSLGMLSRPIHKDSYTKFPLLTSPSAPPPQSLKINLSYSQSSEYKDAVRRIKNKDTKRYYPYFKKPSQCPLASAVRFESPEKTSPPSVSRQDSGNKSNPSSPVKSQSSVSSQGCSSITRSRSLDDLEKAEQEFYEPIAAINDIDNVSQSISQLHVS